MRRVVNAHKIALDFDIAVMHMDDEIREYLHEEITTNGWITKPDGVIARVPRAEVFPVE